MHRLTDHHIIPKHGNELWGVNWHENIIRLKDHVHQAFHIVFSNAEPHNQLAVLVQINWRVLQREYTKRVIELANEDPKYVYLDWLYRPR